MSSEKTNAKDQKEDLGKKDEDCCSTKCCCTKSEIASFFRHIADFFDRKK